MFVFGSNRGLELPSIEVHLHIICKFPMYNGGEKGKWRTPFPFSRRRDDP
jgi:hypothetical protein